jgi:ribosomal protein S18 acetylase RimI-like enzyme
MLRDAGLFDLPGMYSVCLRTGADGQDASARYANPDLLGHTYVGPYPAADPGLCLVVADAEGVGGYVLATADTARFEQWRERDWLPPLRTQYPQGSEGPDQDLIALLHAPPISPPAIAAEYPAHLHIDLLPRLQGHGLGRALIEELLARLRRRTVAGVHLCVGSANERAQGFYRRLGFAELQRTGGATYLGLLLGD